MTQQNSRATGGTIVAITSGKGGVGKTNVVLNLAASLARLGNRVGILDADFGLGNVDVLLGLSPQFHLGHYLSGEKSLDEVVVEGPHGVRIIPAGNGIRALTHLGKGQWKKIEGALKKISAELDFLLIDTGAGISDNVIELLLMAERVLVVTSFDPAAVVDAYAVIKILTGEAPSKEIGVIVNSTRNADEAQNVFRQLDVAASKFLRRTLRFFGYVVYDNAVREAVLGQRLVVEYLPQAPASRCFRILASRLAGIAPGGGAGLRLASRGGLPTIRQPEPLAPEAVRCA
jgi:flagellar biosynthesis protein FlhG